MHASGGHGPPGATGPASDFRLTYSGATAALTRRQSGDVAHRCHDGAVPGNRRVIKEMF